jgi:hypothetical protein
MLVDKSEHTVVGTTAGIIASRLSNPPFRSTLLGLPGPFSRIRYAIPDPLVIGIGLCTEFRGRDYFINSVHSPFSTLQNYGRYCEHLQPLATTAMIVLL